MPPWVPPPLPPRFAAARQLPLVGRQYELETFERVWAEVEHGRRHAVFVGGEPGAGKTRLTAEVAGALHDNDVGVLVGTSAADIGVPYQPFAEMLDQLFGVAPPGSLAGIVDEHHARELARLSPHVRDHLAVDEAGEPPSEGRRVLFDAVVRLFRHLAEARPLALVLDDLHWAQLPTLALLQHVVNVCADARMLVVVTFRTTAPDRSDELASVVAELHRLDGVRRLDLSGLDTDAIAEYLSLRGGMPVRAARAPAAVLRERTGGNPFLLRELWTDLERRGGVAALRHPNRVPASIADTVSTRLAGMGAEVRGVVELAAILGDSFELSTLVAASDVEHSQTMAFVDSAMALGLIEEMADDGRYAFVHSLTRQAVLDRLPPSRRILLHARAAEALERQPVHPSRVARLAHHYVAAYSLGFHDRALHHTTEAGRLAERGLAFEEAAMWFERAAGLPETPASTRTGMHFAAAANWVRAGHFPSARRIYEHLATTAEPAARLAAAVGYEDTNWRPGRPDSRAVDLLSSALDDSGLSADDPKYVVALGSLGRALTFAGERERAREVGSRAIELARRLGSDGVLSHTLAASLWAGITPDMSALQLERTTELFALGDGPVDETLGAGNFLAMASYMEGRPEELERATAALQRVAQVTAQPYFRHIYGCVMQALSFLRGQFSVAERWANESLEMEDTFGDDMTEGPHGVQMYMIHRETGRLDRFRSFLDGHESFAGRWVPALLALYTEVGVDDGVRRALAHLMDRDLRAHTDQAQWPMELAFMVEGALAVGDRDALAQLRPLLADYEGKNLASGALIAVFGSADRYLGRIDAFLGELDRARRHLDVALRLDETMHSVVHIAETLAHQALLAAAEGRTGDARVAADRARRLAESCGQERVLRTLEALVPSPGAEGPDGLTARELDVLRLVVEGLSNREIGERLHISANTAANHVRSILTKTGAGNRTQAAIWAAQHQLA
jgi:DNA-binding CsgD family transcriptional regulator